MAEGTRGSFFAKINNEVEKQMNNDLKNLVLMLMNWKCLLNQIIISMAKLLKSWLKNCM